jgi:hypothetical protein
MRAVFCSIIVVANPPVLGIIRDVVRAVTPFM